MAEAAESKKCKASCADPAWRCVNRNEAEIQEENIWLPKKPGVKQPLRGASCEAKRRVGGDKRGAVNSDSRLEWAVRGSSHYKEKVLFFLASEAAVTDRSIREEALRRIQATERDGHFLPWTSLISGAAPTSTSPGDLRAGGRIVALSAPAKASPRPRSPGT